MDVSVLPSKLLSNLQLATELIRSHNFIHVYSHFDTDGLTSASIIAKALIRENKEFDINIFPTLGENQMQVIEGPPSECVLVTDLGASYIKRFDAMSCDVIVLYHHEIIDEAERICYANPHLYGIDGGSAGCGATLAFLFAITLDSNNWDLAPLAVTGMVGDRQHIKGMSGLNAPIVDEAVKRNLVQILPGSLIPVGNLSTELYMCTDPFVKGISGDSNGTAAFLKEANIAPGTSYSDLTPEESLRLSSLIAIKLIDQGVSRDKLEECARTRYYLPTWGTDAETLSSVINACRDEHYGTGIAACLGDSSALDDAKRYDADSRKKIMTGILSILDKVQEMEYIKWFDSSDTGFTGIICAIVMNYIGNPDKPAIAINCADEIAKASSRGSFPLLDRGLKLSEVMRDACASVGGEGGGHKIAAGGSFPSENRDRFINEVNRLVGLQLNSKN